MNYVIRKRKKEDCKYIQKIITRCWQDTYRGIINDEYLDSLSDNEEERIKNSENNFDENSTYLVIEIDNKVVGFTKYGVSIKEGYGEIFALYLLKEYQGNGYGKKLVASAIEELRKMNFNKILIGCLKDNPSNKFYEHLGGKVVDTRIFERSGQKLLENVYCYDI
ncbi:MAG: GNAT family N-acetyltransferase [Lactobacillales bacterium]|nr:GNAT family N-acetyltransferase [Lactobacillales bacterium]